MRLPAHLRGRLGYTTGACAAAALKAALLALRGRASPRVRLVLPVGLEAEFAVHRLEVRGGEAVASVVKDAGDDPDVTHRAEIVVRVRLRPGRGGMALRAGEGVGTVTKPGLGLPVGEVAVTRVPRKMLSRVAEEVLGRERETLDLEVEISIPGGEELARKTLNPRLGIEGGLSILGTKGVVIPYSTAAYRATIAKAMQVARAQGVEALVLTTGGRSEAFCRRLLPRLPEESFVQVGDYAGFSLRLAALMGFGEVILGMMVGKMAKLAAGFRHTHASRGEVPFALLLEVAREAGVPEEALGLLSGARTARRFLEVVQEHCPERLAPFGALLCRRAVSRAREMARREISVRAILLGFEGEPIAECGR